VSRKEQFMWAVQTGCLVRALKENWDMGHPVRIMAVAAKVPEEAIPEDIDGAAYTYLQWQFKYGSLEDGNEPPEWLAPYMRVDSETGEYCKA
jgi:hypothetical protein